MRRDPETGKPMYRGIRPAVRRDGRTVMLPGWYADGDDNGIHTGRDLRVME
jgi:HTH-type transcriptional regulator/antitoxin MqsA